MFLGTIALGQSVRIDTFRLKESSRFKEIQSDKMNFPIVRSGNKKIDSVINTDLKNRFTGNEYPNSTIDSTLIKWGDGIISLDFEVTYNERGILSINISAEGCGAYCTNWTDYFNYSTVSGKWLDISEIIDTTSAFKEIVLKDKEGQYKQQRQNLREALNDPDWGLSQDEYESALQYYNDCDNSLMPIEYALYSDYLEIIEECWLPHVMRPLTPIIELKYKFSQLGEYLKIKN